MNRQKLILFILLILFAGSIVWSFFAMPKQQSVSELKNRQGEKAQLRRESTKSAASQISKKRDVAADNSVLHIESLEDKSGSFTGYRKNLFKPIFQDEARLAREKLAMQKNVVKQPPPMPVIKQQIQAGTQKGAQTVAKPQQEAARPEPPRSALARFTFIGFLVKEGKKTIFLSKDKEIILVRKGERFGSGKYEITTIADTSLTIYLHETGEEIIVPIAENKPLTAAK